ncbi:MAG: putative sensor domain DACNV-containing protein, partial [Rhodothermales bacterium]
MEAAFWASLRREEGRDPKISLALLPPELAGEVQMLAEPIHLVSDELARLAPAVIRPGIHLGVWPDNDGALTVWGMARSLPWICFVLEVIEPGLLVVKYRRGEGIGKFGNIAVLKGEEARLVDERVSGMTDYPPVLKSLLSFDGKMSFRDSAAVLVQLALSMRAHGHGGTLLVIPPENRSWKDSLVRPLLYEIRAPRSEILRVMNRDVGEENQSAERDEMNRAVDAVAGLTAVDGATVFSSTIEVLAFG